MRYLAFERAGVVAWREGPSPQISSGLDAIVSPLVVGRCDLDAAFVRGLAPIAAGSALGHECIAEVVDVGSLVRTVRPGDVVVVSAQICCGYCRNCRRGHTGRCESVPFAASFGMGRAGDFGGALAERMRVPYADAMLVPLPSALDPVDAIGAADMALDAWRAVGPALEDRGDASVLVVGGSASVIGLYAAGIARAMGATEVVYWDDDERRRAAAAAFDVRTLDASQDPPGSFDVVVDAGGDVDRLHRALRAAAPEALFTSVTIYFDNETPLPLRDMYFKGVTFRTGRPNVRPQMESVLRICRSGAFRPHAVPATLFDFDRAQEAWLSTELRVAVTREARSGRR
jgi:threonine dehydrogenase-like Zn-dependent dehydrogenase